MQMHVGVPPHAAKRNAQSRLVSLSLDGNFKTRALLLEQNGRAKNHSTP